ncbi:Protein transport protein S9 plasma membrane t-SNARE [Orbilia javanica]|uniref:Protein transport protein S9 plasma membrane t-SNARE n=1 Tax=Orbilia javanica TaxID=47235 RepID=A0AAN8RGP7_9PEZI
MGLFKKKDKTARAGMASGVPDTTAASNQPAKNPYAYSPPPPSYVSQPTYSQRVSYGPQNNEPTTYGGSIYNQRSTEPTGYGGSGSAYGDSKTPEPVPYGASPYNNNSRQANPTSSNPYGAPSYGNNNQNNIASGNPYGAPPNNNNNNNQNKVASSNPYGASSYSNNNRASNVATSNPYGATAPANQPGRSQPNDPNLDNSYSAGRGGYHYGGNSYQDSYSYQTTALADDEQDPELIKQEIKYTKYASHASTVNALHAAARAEQAGQSTLLNLEQQGESLYNTQLNLKIAKTHGDIASHQAHDLKVANRPLFMPHVKNPFSSGQNKIIDEQVSLERQRRERNERGSGVSGAKLTHEEKMRKMGLAPVGAPKPISKEERAARERQRSMYQFEADEEDEQLERDIDTNIDLLAGASKRLRGIAGDIHQKVEEQNKLIMDINNQAQDVEDGLVRAGHKLRPYGY